MFGAFAVPYLDTRGGATPYSAESICRALLRVVRDRKAHCFDGACFAAGMLMRLGHPPMLVEHAPLEDDDPVIAGLQARSLLGSGREVESAPSPGVDGITYRANLNWADANGCTSRSTVEASAPTRSARVGDLP